MRSYRTHLEPSQADWSLMLSSEFAHSDYTQNWVRRKWYCKLADEHPDPKIAVTLTLKQGRMRDNGTLQHINETEIKRLIKHLHQKINRQVFGIAAKRHKLRTFMLPAIEGGGDTGKRLHIHLSIGVPLHYNPNCFMEWLSGLLSKTNWVYEQYDIRPLPTEEEHDWHWYICKQYIELDLFDPDPPRQREMLM